MHLAHHLGAGAQGLVALVLPLGGAALVLLAREVDVGLELAHELVDVAAHVVEVDLAVEERAVRGDDEGATQRQAFFGRCLGRNADRRRGTDIANARIREVKARRLDAQRRRDDLLTLKKRHHVSDTAVESVLTEVEVTTAELFQAQAELTRAQVLVQAGNSILAIANAQQQNVLSLLGG